MSTKDECHQFHSFALALTWSGAFILLIPGFQPFHPHIWNVMHNLSYVVITTLSIKINQENTQLHNTHRQTIVHITCYVETSEGCERPKWPLLLPAEEEFGIKMEKTRITHKLSHIPSRNGKLLLAFIEPALTEQVSEQTWLPPDTSLALETGSVNFCGILHNAPDFLSHNPCHTFMLLFLNYASFI